MQQLISEVQRRMSAVQLPGVSIRIAQGPETVFACDLGVRDLSSQQALKSGLQFRVGSLTKPIIAQAVLGLVKRGAFALDAPVGAHIDELGSKSGFRSITISQLLGHESGLARGPYRTESEPDDVILEGICSSGLLFTPGSSWKYSNWGYFLLGILIERTSGMSVEKYLAQTIFGPQGMKQTTIGQTPDRANARLATGHWDGRRFGHPDVIAPLLPCPHEILPESAAGLITTSDDYIRWLTRISSQAADDSLIDPAMNAQLLAVRRQLTSSISSGFGCFGEQHEFGLLLTNAGMRSGFSACSFVIPKHEIAGVAFTNCGARTDALRELLHLCASKSTETTVPAAAVPNRPISILAASRAGRTIRFESDAGETPQLVCGESTGSLHPLSARTYHLRHEDRPQHVLRLNRNRPGDAILAIGDQVFFERLSRLRRLPAAPEPWTELAGIYLHPVIGRVEVIHRERQLYLDYGAMYETLLDPIEDLRFNQNSGPFRYESIEFTRDAETGTVWGLSFGGMTFDRSSAPAAA